MKMKRIILFTAIIWITSFTAQAQTLSAKVVDKKTNEPIPYATIQIGENQGIVTNEEGKFSLTLNNLESTLDSIYISSMGYTKVGVSVQNITDSIIYVQPKAIELKSVFISNKNLTIDEIIDNVDDKMEDNYRSDLSKKRLFFRETNTSFIKKMDIEFKKSTIEEIDEKLVDSISKVVPRNSVFYAEALCDFYGNTKKQKLNVIKGARLYDKNNGGSFEEIFEKMEKIFRDNVKPNSYIKIRSGLFSQKVQVDSILNANEDAADIAEGMEDPKKENLFFRTRKMNLKNLFNETFYQSDTKLNIIKNSGRYHFKKTDYTILGDVGVYVIEFTPKRRGDFKGTLYVNTEDFAIIRIDYQNVKRLRSFNMLGVSFQENGYRGTTTFEKGADGKYDVKFIEKVTENKFGVDRPLSIIEKNKYVKGRRKQNQVSLNLDVISYAKNKYEVIVFDAQNITDSEFSNSKENKNVTSSYLSKYDPNFWKGYNIIEPNTAIKQFKVIEEEEDIEE